MKKLTAEKCRSVIEGFKWMAAEGPGMSIRDEYDIQAYEHALKALEQQERGEGEWIEWGGGECPVPDCTIVEVRFRSGRQRRGAKAEEYIWTNGYGELSETGADIIAYRIIPKQPTNQNGEQ
ncbi:hypothetical protein [Pantoea agglomerans]|uniref:hypothetical protein n=1 Tax=Enterobacter agglomerans TaxID=549 RepID=UPI001783726C|nr:hypothetical protein [Pantoea agglomerans]MBD8260514.1 hypothetical protein [Pantoea agglomerans]